MQGHFPLEDQDARTNLVVWTPAPKEASEESWVPGPMGIELRESIDPPFHAARFGFAGPDNRAVSLTVSAEVEAGQNHRTQTFDIEFDPDQPGMLAICLMETDEDNFIHTAQRSVTFPARLLAELLRRRKATAQEVAAWLATPHDED